MCVSSKGIVMIHHALVLLLVWWITLGLGQISYILSLSVSNWEVSHMSKLDKDQLCFFMDALAFGLFLHWFQLLNIKFVCLFICLLTCSCVCTYVSMFHVFPIFSALLFRRQDLTIWLQAEWDFQCTSHWSRTQFPTFQACRCEPLYLTSSLQLNQV